MIACLIFNRGVYPANIIKLIIEAQFKNKIIEFDEKNSSLNFYIYNVDLFKVLQLMDQFEIAKLSLMYGCGFGFSKSEAKKYANMKLLVNKSKWIF